MEDIFLPLFLRDSWGCFGSFASEATMRGIAKLPRGG